jgi:hypothetical protein
MIYLQNNKQKILARIVSVKRKEMVMLLETEVNLPGKISTFPVEFTLRSKWHAKLVMKLNTFIREFESISTILALPLCSNILNPVNESQYVLAKSKVEEYSTNLGLDLPQAEAVVAAMAPKKGFVLIQGPPVCK